jgi:hypothetical protein
MDSPSSSSSSRVVPFVRPPSPSDESGVRELIDTFERLPIFEQHVVLYWVRRYAGELPRQQWQLRGNF